jgi:hypothetical protein
MRKIIAHFKKSIILEEPNVWYMMGSKDKYKFLNSHFRVEYQLKKLGFNVSVAEEVDSYGSYHIISIQFDDDADEAEFILKYNNGIEVELLESS